ncbi:DNA cytosine methyltransferase [Natronincola ferrireducens]|uniref:DNA (cytosine-5-)-methyltransferase n=1 Tax=Natronincola ferrireducens TaxID=393762 RepID=A0A1G9H8J0_9FIRM|nr:DNA cytosine methyltransferase [Natronincola ferrireducens]SDL09134.1 DNA (cytosine-5)-methyltransferase 1 [Natronincola ferrireducens]
MSKYNVVDLFCSAGGFSYGFHKAGFDIILGVDSDINKLETYHYNLSRLNNCSIKKLSINDLKHDIFDVTYNKMQKIIGNNKVHVLLGSPPCKNHSKQNSDRNVIPDTLAKEFVRLVVSIDPIFFVMENVPSFFTSSKTFFTDYFYFILESQGYTIQQIKLNAVDFGIPQNRERTFFIGNKLATHISLDKYKQKHKISIKDAISDLAYESSCQEADYREANQNELSEYQKLMRQGSTKLYNHKTPIHTQTILEIIKNLKQGERYTKKSSKFSNAYVRAMYNEPASTITTRLNISNSPIHPVRNRCFSPREAARLQSFDDKFLFIGDKESITTQIGDAVPPLLAKTIGECLLDKLIK